jgi:hypothetical protein
VVLNSVETGTHLRGPLCRRQQRALLEWQDIIYPDNQNGQGLRRHRGPRGGGGRHGGGNYVGEDTRRENYLGAIR